MNCKMIEFNGLPGSGKTTITHYISKNYYENKLKLINLKNDDIYKKHIRLKSFRLLKNLLVPNRIYILIILIGFMHKNHSINVKNIYRGIHIINLYNLYKLINKSNESEDTYYLLDQGIIQEIISILYDKKINKKSFKWLIKLIKFTYSEFSIINSKVSVEESLIRIQSRISNTSRLDKLSEEKANKVLRVQYENFKILREIVHSLSVSNLDINTNESLSHNAKKIINFLLSNKILK